MRLPRALWGWISTPKILKRTALAASGNGSGSSSVGHGSGNSGGDAAARAPAEAAAAGAAAGAVGPISALRFWISEGWTQA